MRNRRKNSPGDSRDTTMKTPQEKDKLVEPDEKMASIDFTELPEDVKTAAGNAGWKKLMEVQSLAIPYLLAGRELMVQSRTGSGKTGAFLLPLVRLIEGNKKACQVLILTPTRELALQIQSEAVKIFKDTEIETAAVYGGVGYGIQLNAFREGVQLVVGTPGRILDHLMRGSLSLKHLTHLMFDEADRLLSMGFYPDMKRVQSYLPKHPVKGYMFSATFPPRVISLAGQFLTRPDVLSLSRDRVHVTEVQHEYCVVRGLDKDRVLIRLLEIENPDSALIFCNTRAQVEYVSTVLRNFGYEAEGLSSDVSQNTREKIVGRIKAGNLHLVVATDVASRGLDIPDLSHVFLYEAPQDAEDYIHRAGRTGRAGASGTAITLVGLIEQMALKRIAKRYSIEMIRRDAPDEKEVREVVSLRLTNLLEAKYRGMDELQKERLNRFIPLAESLAQKKEFNITAMLLDEMYHQALHAPVYPVQDEPSQQQKTERRRSRPHRRSGREQGGKDKKQR